MKEEILIREETPADVNDVAEVTVAAFRTLEISNHTEQFIISALRAAMLLRSLSWRKLKGEWLDTSPFHR